MASGLLSGAAAPLMPPVMMREAASSCPARNAALAGSIVSRRNAALASRPAADRSA